MLQLKFTVSSILRKYKISASNSQKELEFVVNLVLKPANGIIVKLERR